MHHGAYHEARRHFEEGLELLPSLPRICPRSGPDKKWRCCSPLGSVLMATEGQAASGVLHTYRQLICSVRRTRRKGTAFLSAPGPHHRGDVRGTIDGLARDLAEQCYALAQGLHERAYMVEALRLLSR